MVPACIRCSSPLAEGRFCPACGFKQPGPIHESDPYVGRRIGDRYEVGELICVGGMGRVHRGLQVSLDRSVAIKFIHPHLLTLPDAVNRFMLEARAASRLNHPNVVHVLDFGRTSDTEGGDLYMVMELLSGSDLGRVLEREGALPYPRAAAIVRQILSALAEAHHRGIIHRDVKPENIVVETLREQLDHVKVIDFGIASMGTGGITQAGQVVGTVGYMAPEQMTGNSPGSSADLYAVGVILFELLTGRLPFEDLSAQRVLFEQLAGPAPDVRVIAPENAIPDEVAEVCARALEADPARRYPDAGAFADALCRAAGLAAPPRIARRDAGASIPSPAPWAAARSAMPETLPSAATLADNRIAASARDELVAAAARALDGEARAVVVWGRPGTGRSQVLRDVVGACARRGDATVLIEADPPPRGSVSYRGLQSAIAALAAKPRDDASLASGQAADDPDAAAALRRLFAEPAPNVARSPEACAPALAWALTRAARNSPRGRVVLAVDDLDRLDAPSRRALSWTLEHRAPTDFALLATRATAPSQIREGVRAIQAPLEPARLDTEQVAARVAALSRSHARTLAAVAILGAASLTATRAVLADATISAQAEATLNALESAGLLRRRGAVFLASHTAVARAACAMLSEDERREMHARAFEALSRPGESVEERAHHALRGRADFEAFFLAEMAAALRESAGDEEGAVAILTDAVRAARSQCARGEVDVGSSALLVLGRKLADSLLRAGRPDEAAGVLSELLDVVGHSERSRALVLERLAAVAYARGLREECDRRWREACDVADRCGDSALALRLRSEPPTALPPAVRAQAAPGL